LVVVLVMEWSGTVGLKPRRRLRLLIVRTVVNREDGC
jgi:hypothetical protein